MPGTRAQTSKATITSPLGNSIKKKRQTPPKANAKRTRLPVAKIDARFASRTILDEEPAVIEYEPNDHAAKEPTKPMAKANKAKAKRKANPSPAHVGTPTLEPGVPETKHDAPSHPKKNKAPPSAIKQLHAMAKKTKCIPQELFSSSSASESEDEGYTTPPIEVESDDSSGDESEGDGSDLEIIEDYDEQLQDNDMDVMDDDSSGEEEVDDDDSSGEEDEEAESNEVEDADDLHEPAIDIKEEVVRVITVTTDSYTSLSRSSRTPSTSAIPRSLKTTIIFASMVGNSLGPPSSTPRPRDSMSFGRSSSTTCLSTRPSKGATWAGRCPKDGWWRTSPTTPTR